MPRRHAALVAAFEHGMAGDQLAVLEDPDLVGERVHLQDASAGGVGHAVEVAADADHALVGDAPLEPEDRAEGHQRQRLEMRLLLGESLVDDPPGGRVDPRVGDRIEPVAQLRVQVVEVAERAGEEEVLADVAERPLDFALGLGPVGPAGLRMEAIVAGEVDERPVVDDVALCVLADDRRLHPVVEDLARHAAERLEGRQVAAQHGLQVLMQDEAGPDQAAVAEHQGEQPDDPGHARLVGERHLELGEVDLRLLAGRGLEADLEDGGRRRPQLAQRVRDGGVAALVAALLQLPQEAPAGQARIGLDPLAQVRDERVDAPGARLARAIGRRLQAAGDVFAHRLAIDAELPGDGRDRQALPMQIQDHDDFPKLDHRPVPSRRWGQHR